MCQDIRGGESAIQEKQPQTVKWRIREGGIAVLFTFFGKFSSDLDNLRKLLNTNGLFQIYSIIFICVSGFNSMNRSITL